VHYEVKELLETGFLYFSGGRDKYFRPILVQILPKIDLKASGERFY